MNTNEFDPRTIDLDAELTPEQRLAAQQQEEETRLAEEKRIGGEHEAAGRNRDGSEKTPPTPPAPTPVQQAPAAAQAQASPSFAELRETKLSTGMRDAPAGGLSLSEEHLKVKELLSNQPKFTIFLPLEPGERRGISYRSVTLNGYRCEVKKGMQVSVPESIYNILMESMTQEAEATEVEENLDRADDRKRSALGLQ